MNDLVLLIEKGLKGIEVYNIDGYDEKYSILPMWRQVADIRERMLPIMRNATNGVNMICFSQGE